ncbi:AT-hook motif nuclear-localized protein 29-like [Vicia villosa]|uniref:AT-hook motif nuclear-localized protein 29-like n=1 Tax=Vicia villosa TaxID=3911 RepID=UPI00273B31CE|nr:AT-hook motif nuclear-localized protein 29-like [Vicia villosa]
MSDHVAERKQELQLFTAPQPEIETPNTNTTVDNNHHVSSSTASRRPRGRPLGSRNKPKMPVIVTHDNTNVVSSHVLEIRAGDDISKSVFDYAHRQERGICILNGDGLVTHVRLRLPTGRVATLQGRFEILLISGTVFPTPTPMNVGGLTVYLSGINEQVIGGSVIPPLVASSLVTLTVASFANTAPEKLSSVVVDKKEHRLPCIDGVGQVRVSDHDLSNAGDSTSGMRNMMSSNISYPSSSTQDHIFGWETTATVTPPPKHPRF